MPNNSLLFPVDPKPSCTKNKNSASEAQNKILEKYKDPNAGLCILLTATLRWPIAARLAMAFASMGCNVQVICPRQHPVTRTRAVRRIYLHSVLRPLAALRAAIESAAPDLIIPCDDDAALHLYRLHESTCHAGPAASALSHVIARSLGSPPACALATSRGRLMSLAAEQGLRVPESAVIATSSQLAAWFIDHTLPAVIKIDCTWGGQGVSIVHHREAAQRVFDLMASRPAITKALARALLERDPSYLLNSLKLQKRTVTVQNFILGNPANRAVACWQGQVLAGISAQAIQTQNPTGPATVVRIIENSEMTTAVNQLVRRLGLSGLWGVDFVLESRTGAAYLVEMNPRATPICHLPLDAGRNLPVALYKQLTGVWPLNAPQTIAHDVIALFPGEWHRDPASAYLRSNYHDIPWHEQELIQDCIAKPWSERGLIARLWARIRPKLPAAIQNKDAMPAALDSEPRFNRKRITPFRPQSMK